MPVRHGAEAHEHEPTTHTDRRLGARLSTWASRSWPSASRGYGPTDEPPADRVLCIGALGANVRICRDSGALKAKRKRRSGPLLDLGDQFSAEVAAVDDTARFGRQYRGLGAGAGGARRCEARGKLAGPERDITISHLDGEPSVGDQEELAGYRCAGAS
jgi:hypothetical protein